MEQKPSPPSPSFVDDTAKGDGGASVLPPPSLSSPQVDQRDDGSNPAAAGTFRALFQSTVRRVSQLRQAIHIPELHFPGSTPSAHAPTVHAPTVHAPTVHAPTMHAPTMHAPTVHAPTVHAPTMHAPTVHAPTMHAPTVHAPTMHAPTVHAPTMHAPTMHAPTMHAPTMHAPTMHAPTIHAPTMHAPTMHAPTMHAPTMHAPTMHAPTMHAPTMHAPTMHAPTMHAPTVHAPTIHAPTVHAPSIHAPTVHAPTVHAPTVHAPSVHVPSKVPVKTLGNVTDRMSQAMDAYGYIEKAVHDNEVKKESRLRRLWNVVKSATPSVVRSVILGTILFTVYDEGVVRTRLEEIKNSNEPSELDKQYKHTSWPRVFLFSGVSGAVAGSINGLLFSLWNKASAPRSPCFPLGFMVSHTIVHCALFSSYELLKRMVMRAGSMDYLDYRGCLAVSAVGGVAGAVQEYVNYFTSPLEENGLNKESWNAIKELSRPKFRSFMTLGIVIPNAIGFLAYEYTKDFILEREEDKESPDDEVSPEPLVDTEDLSVGNDSMLLANQFTPATLSPIPMSPINQETQNNLKEAEL